MLRDITLGQYFPGDTVIHRLDPRVKIVAVIFYIVALFAASNAYAYIFAVNLNCHNETVSSPLSIL